jgi:hypothetical protein
MSYCPICNPWDPCQREMRMVASITLGVDKHVTTYSGRKDLRVVDTFNREGVWLKHEELIRLVVVAIDKGIIVRQQVLDALSESGVTPS